jgi:hypothetical protein
LSANIFEIFFGQLFQRSASFAAGFGGTLGLGAKKFEIFFVGSCYTAAHPAICLYNQRRILMSEPTLTRADCLARDAQDPLAPLRERFDLPAGVIYLDGNSLGARPRAALARAQDVVAREWGQDLIKSWDTAGWFDLPKRLGQRLAPLVGARPTKSSSPTPPR